MTTPHEEAQYLKPYFPAAVDLLRSLLNDLTFIKNVIGVSEERMLGPGAEYKGAMFRKDRHALCREATEELADYLVYTARAIDLHNSALVNMMSDEAGDRGEAEDSPE